MIAVAVIGVVYWALTKLATVIGAPPIVTVAIQIVCVVLVCLVLLYMAMAIIPSSTCCVAESLISRFVLRDGVARGAAPLSGRRDSQTMSRRHGPS